MKVGYWADGVWRKILSAGITLHVNNNLPIKESNWRFVHLRCWSIDCNDEIRYASDSWLRMQCTYPTPSLHGQHSSGLTTHSVLVTRCFPIYPLDILSWTPVLLPTLQLIHHFPIPVSSLTLHYFCMCITYQWRLSDIYTLSSKYISVHPTTTLPNWCSSTSTMGPQW